MTEIKAPNSESISITEVKKAFQHFLEDLRYPIHANVLAKQLESFNTLYGLNISADAVISVIEKSGRKVLNQQYLAHATAGVQADVNETIADRSWEFYVGERTK